MSGAVDYQVGPGKAYTEPSQVPWNTLQPGDTVRIFYRDTPYRTKFLIAAQGTSAAPVRICGVRGPGNERPIIDGENAVTATTLTAANDYGTAANNVHQTRSIIVIKQLVSQNYTDYPRHIQIDGLVIRRAHPKYTFTDASGTTRNYVDFGACIWVDRGQDITIADNEISDCSQAIFSKSTNDGDFAVTKNLRVAGNHLWGNGYEGDASRANYFNHTTYLQSVGVTVEFNHYGPLRDGAGGNQLKDRSAGLVVRYNYFEGGAHTLDLVEAEDGFQYVVKPLAAYRSTYVYGNAIRNDAGARAIVHYGGDHFGSTTTDDSWGELNFRKGTLYFFHNTVHMTGTGGSSLFRISTTEETVEAWNNIFHANGTAYLRTAENDGVGSAWTRDGLLNLGVNWITTGWLLNNPYNTLQGSVSGTSNLSAGSTAPFDTTTFLPLSASAILNAALAGPVAANAYPVDYQPEVSTGSASTRTAVTTLGAHE